MKERLRCHHVQLKVAETTMGRKEQRERERKKAAKGSYALSGFGFLPKRRSWSDGDLNAAATSQRAARGRGQLFAIVPSATRTRRRKLFADLTSSSTQVSAKLRVIFVPAGPQKVSPVLNDLVG